MAIIISVMYVLGCKIQFTVALSSFLICKSIQVIKKNRPKNDYFAYKSHHYIFSRKPIISAKIQVNVQQVTFNHSNELIYSLT